MCWAAREVALGVAVVWVTSVLPACSPRFVRSGVDGGSAGEGGAVPAGEGGAPVNAGGETPMGGGGQGGSPFEVGGEGGQSGRHGEGGYPPTAGSGEGGGGGEVECEVELLKNGGFDLLNRSAWVQVADPARGLVLHQSSSLLANSGHSPVSPEYALWLGGVPSDKSAVSQQVVVPAGTLALVVSFYWHIDWLVDEPEPRDTVTLRLTTSANETVPIAVYSNLDINADWEPVSFELDAAPYRGKTATFALESETDEQDHTAFLFDSFSLVAKRCDP